VDVDAEHRTLVERFLGMINPAGGRVLRSPHWNFALPHAFLNHLNSRRL
jgi:hypothetical protein